MEKKYLQYVTSASRLHRASQTYGTTILLCEEILPAPVIYGTMVPLISWLALQKLVIQPYLRQRKQTELLKQRESNKSRYVTLFQFWMKDVFIAY